MTIRVLDNEWEFSRDGEQWESFTKLKIGDEPAIEVSGINKLAVSGCGTIIIKSNGKWYNGKYEVQPRIEIIGSMHYLVATPC